MAVGSNTDLTNFSAAMFDVVRKLLVQQGKERGALDKVRSKICTQGSGYVRAMNLY